MKSRAVIEMPAGTNEKIEIKDGRQIIDRILKVKVPVNYGFIPNTLAEDGDALDVMVISADPIPPGSEVDIQILGVCRCLDQGIPDDKLVATSPWGLLDITTLKKIENYLRTYKEGFEFKEFVTPYPEEEFYKYLVKSAT